MLELADKDIKTVIITVFNMFKKLIKDIEDRKRPKLSFRNKTAMSEIKHTMDRMNNRLDIIEKSISKLKDIAIELYKMKQRETRIKKCKEHL